MNFASCPWSASLLLFHVVSTFAHFSNEISTFSFRHRLALFAPRQPIDDDEVDPRSLQGRSRSQKVAARSVWRALSGPDFSFHFRMLKICYVFHHFWRTCPPDRSVRSVWRAPPRRSGSPLGRRSGHSGRSSWPRRPAGSRALRVPGPEVALERPSQESRRQGRPEALQATHKTPPQTPADFLIVDMFDKAHVCNRNQMVLTTVGASIKCCVDMT